MQAERLICANCGRPIDEREDRVQRSTDGATVHESCPEWGAPETASGNTGGGKADQDVLSRISGALAQPTPDL